MDNSSLRVDQSMSAKGNCYDNATCKSFFATLKSEAFPEGGTFTSKRAAHLAIFEYLETFYNQTRRHSSLGWLSPNMFLKQYLKSQKQHLN